MPSSAGLEFDTIFKATSANSGFTNITLEMQSPLGIATTVFDTASHYLYLGDADRFDMAVFDLATSGSLGTLTWEFSDGSNGWTAFTPSSGRLSRDVNDPDAGAGYAFNRDGVEMFPSNQLSSWGTQAVNSQTKYWIRVTPSTVTGIPQLYRIQKRPYATYCSTQDVFNFLQLGNITGTTDFTAATTPSKSTVEQYIQSAESKVDYLTRKSWRPNYVAEEYHDFNLNGFKLDRPDPTRILRLSIWDGADWEAKTAGRKNEYFLLPELGMVQFSRYFLLPARFMSYNAPVWRFGGGEFMMPIKVDYLSGRDIHADAREAGIVFDSTRKLVAIEVLRSADFGTLVVSGSDRMQIAKKIDSWSMEVELMLDSMRAFEVF